VSSSNAARKRRRQGASGSWRKGGADKEREARLRRYHEADDPQVQARIRKVLDGRTMVEFVKEVRDEVAREERDRQRRRVKT
jgi:hypothetical protein